MKKLIAISITLALVASAAFAQVTVGGQVSMGWVPFQGDNTDDSSVTSGFGKTKAYISARAVSENEVLGAYLRAFTAGSDDASFFGYAWFQPIQQVKFTLGQNGDGIFGADTLAGWNFNGVANESVAENSFSSGAFVSGWSNLGAWLELTPIEGLAINFAVPGFTETDYTKGHSEDVKDSAGVVVGTFWVSEPDTSRYAKVWKDFQKLRAQVSYNISGIGTAIVTYQGGAFTSGSSGVAQTGKAAFDTDQYGNGVDTGAIYAAFQLSAIENLGLDIGFKYALPVKDDASKKTYNSPVEIGLGAKYDMGDFGVAGRLNFAFAGNVKPENGDADPVPFEFQLNLKPYYNLGILKAYLNLGLDLITDQEDKDGNNISNLHMGWYVNPYIEKTLGGASFFAGFQLKGMPVQDGGNFVKGDVAKWKTDLYWAIPVGINLYF